MAVIEMQPETTRRLTVESFLPADATKSVLSQLERTRIERLATMLTLKGRQTLRPKFFVY